MKNKISNEVLNLFPVLLVFYEIANYLANDAYLPALPIISQQLHTTSHLAQLTLTMFFLGNATMQLILGPISDRYGRRTLLLSGGLVFLSTTLFCALTSNIYSMLIARYLQGSAVTSLIIAGYATIHAMYDQTRSIKTLAWMNSINVLAPALGPLFGALILLIGSWRWIFIILALWSFFALIALYRYMPETCDTTKNISIKRIFYHYWAGVTNRKFLQPTLSVSLLFAAMIAWITAGPFLIMKLFHYSAIAFGFIQGLVFGSFILGTRWVGKYIEKMPIYKITNLSIILAIIGGILFLLLRLSTKDNLFSMVFPMMILALGAGIGFPVFNRLAIEGSNEPMGIKVALFSSFMGMGGLIGSVAISTFYKGTTFSFSLIMASFTSLITLIYLYRISRSCRYHVSSVPININSSQNYFFLLTYSFVHIISGRL